MNTKKTGLLRKAFNYAGTAFLAVHFGASSLVGDVNDRTAEEAARLGLNEAELRQLAATPFNTFYPEDKAAYAVPLLQGLFKVYGEFKSEHNHAKNATTSYEFFGASVRNPLYGHKGVLDILTLGTTRTLFPCSVVVSSGKLAAERIKGVITGLSNPQNFPGVVEDYQKLFLIHEIAHCDQSPRETREAMERNADIVSIDFYLKHGGNPEVVKTIIYGRAITAMTSFIVSTPQDKDSDGPHDYIMGPALHHRFIDGSGPVFSPAAIRAGYIEAVKTLGQLAGGDMLSLYNQKELAVLAHAALLRPDVSLSPAARHILQLHREANDFFMTPRPAPKADPRPFCGPCLS